MTERTVNTTSGRTSYLNERTDPKNGATAYMKVRSVSVTVSADGQGGRFASLNDKLRGNASKVVSSK